MRPCRRVIIVDPEGNTLETFDSVQDAARITGISEVSIIQRCKHRMVRDEYILQDFLHKHSLFTFRYEGDTDLIQHRSKRRYNKVVMIDRDGNVLAEYRNQRDAARKTGFSITFISRRVRGYASREFEEWDYSFRLKEDDDPTPYSVKTYC